MLSSFKSKRNFVRDPEKESFESWERSTRVYHVTLLIMFIRCLIKVYSRGKGGETRGRVNSLGIGACCVPARQGEDRNGVSNQQICDAGGAGVVLWAKLTFYCMYYKAPGVFFR